MSPPTWGAKVLRVPLLCPPASSSWPRRGQYNCKESRKSTLSPPPNCPGGPSPTAASTRPASVCSTVLKAQCDDPPSPQQDSPTFASPGGRGGLRQQCLHASFGGICESSMETKDKYLSPLSFVSGETAAPGVLLTMALIPGPWGAGGAGSLPAGTRPPAHA